MTADRASLRRLLREQDRPVLVSACLLGIPTAYDGSGALQTELLAWASRGQLVPVCPEVAGGLAIPRPPAEIVGGDGGDVLAGRARVVTVEGVDVTMAYVRGAEAALAVARRYDVELAILKQRSPSCGSSTIYDGSHSGRLVPGRGVTAAHLQSHDVLVKSEDEAKGSLNAL